MVIGLRHVGQEALRQNGSFKRNDRYRCFPEDPGDRSENLSPKEHSSLSSSPGSGVVFNTSITVRLTPTFCCCCKIVGGACTLTFGCPLDLLKGVCTEMEGKLEEMLAVVGKRRVVGRSVFVFSLPVA